jgi:hypothetical protein
MFEELMDSKTLFLTANTTTIYNFGWLNGVVTLTSYHQKFGKVQILDRCYSMT